MRKLKLLTATILTTAAMSMTALAGDMKKIRFVLIILLITFSLPACGGSNKKPDHMSDDAYNAGIKALGLVDKYLNSELSEEDVCTELSNIHDSFVALDDEESYKDLGLKIKILTLSQSIIKMISPNGIMETSDSKLIEIYKNRDEFAESLGIEKKYEKYYEAK